MRRLRLAILIVVVLSAAAGLVVSQLVGGGGSSALTVMVAGRAVHLDAGTTLAEAAVHLGLHPRAGDLIDVNGKVLRDGVVPGKLFVNGHLTSPTVRLRSGDRIGVVDGHDRREPLVSHVVRVPGGAPSDPQFTVTRTPGEQVVVRGALSGELVSARFRASGKEVVAKAVALTFDDGPSPQYTPRVLAMLTKLRVRATFFVVGYLAGEYPDLIRRELRLGMTVGNHTYNHPEVPPFDRLPPRLRDDEIALGARILSGLGPRPRLFRPPGGSSSTTIVDAAAARGQRVVLWSVDATDWKSGISPRQIARRVLSDVRPGSIVILHDGGGDRSATVAALPAIVRGIRRRGLHLTALAPGPAPVKNTAGNR